MDIVLTCTAFLFFSIEINLVVWRVQKLSLCAVGKIYNQRSTPLHPTPSVLCRSHIPMHNISHQHSSLPKIAIAIFGKVLVLRHTVWPFRSDLLQWLSTWKSCLCKKRKMWWALKTCDKLPLPRHIHTSAKHLLEVLCPSVYLHLSWHDVEDRVTMPMPTRLMLTT